MGTDRLDKDEAMELVDGAPGASDAEGDVGGVAFEQSGVDMGLDVCGGRGIVVHAGVRGCVPLACSFKWVPDHQAPRHPWPTPNHILVSPSSPIRPSPPSTSSPPPPQPATPSPPPPPSTQPLPAPSPPQAPGPTSMTETSTKPE